MREITTIASILLCALNLSAQNYTFDFNTSGRRVCLVSSEANLSNTNVKLIFLDSLSNKNEPLFVSRRPLGTTTWTSIAANILAGNGHWIDNNVNLGDIWEYQVKRQNTWNYDSKNYDATGYAIGALLYDNTPYKGQMILLVSDDIPVALAVKYARLKKEITADGWYLNELLVPRAKNWDSGNEVESIKIQIAALYNNAPSNDKPKALFILGHVPLPRSGSTNLVAPDDHNENKGARGCDAYYADLDGVFTDTATYNPGGLSTPLALNLPGDFKWDQDFFPSDIEMAFGRIDFADITELAIPEITLIENYLDRLSNYRNVSDGFNMGEKSAFYLGYQNSNDGSYRSLFSLSKPNEVFQNETGPNHNQWVQNNGPFKIYMQNLLVPEISDWLNHGMNATVFTSDQSHWGFGDVPQPTGINSRIRTLLGLDSKCLIAFWTTMGINIFHQACTGKPLGIAMKEIMNHNQSNQYLEKPPQEYDTENWWNRSHFAFYGDPTLNLYQISPPSNPSIVESNGEALLQWTESSDSNVVGYHIYESDAELGIYQRATKSLVTTNSYIIPDYVQGKWYMVKSIKLIESGCGKFLHSSLGVMIDGDITLSIKNQNIEDNISIYPNPSNKQYNVYSPQILESLQVYTVQGSKILSVEKIEQRRLIIDCLTWPDGVYCVSIKTIDGNIQTLKLIKNSGY